MDKKTTFPTLESVKEGIKLILAKNFDEYKYKNDIRGYFKELDSFFLSSLGLLLYGFIQSKGESMITQCYRLRKYDKSINPNLISEFSHPPPSSANKIQRANLPYHPVFYGSPDIKTSIIETFQGDFDKSIDQTYFISEWSFRKNEIYNVVPFLYGNTSEDNIFRKLGDSALLKLESQSADLTSENIEVMKTVLRFLAGLFVYENTHVISSYIAHSYLYANHNFRGDVFIYPSVQAGKHTVNFAIHPNAVFHKMVLEKIYFIKISDYKILNKKKVKIKFNLIKEAINNSGILVWQDVNDDIDNRFLKRFEGLSIS